MKQVLIHAVILSIVLASGCAQNKNECRPSSVVTNATVITNAPCETPFDDSVKIGDIYTLREARLVLDVSYGMIVYRQVYYHEPCGWMYSTNCMPVHEFTNRWIRVK